MISSKFKATDGLAMRFQTVGTVLILATASVIDCCGQCRPNDKTTIWGGNGLVVFEESRPMAEVQGTVLEPARTPFSNVLVEIYNHLEVVLKSSRHNNPSTQTRITACITDASGRFKLSVPSGDCEVRFSYSTEFDVRSVVVKVRTSHFYWRRRLKVGLKLGT
jgi:hypothetical protein